MCISVVLIALRTISTRMEILSLQAERSRGEDKCTASWTEILL